MKRAKVEKRSLSIPNEIVYLIFLELPVKSLLRFKCVSKEWNSIIEEREFVDSHRLKSRTRPGGGTDFLRLRFGQEGKNGSPVLLVLDSEGNPEPIGNLLDQSRWSLQNVKRFRCRSGREFWCRQFRESVLGLLCFGDIILNPSTKEAIKLPDHDGDWWEYIIGCSPTAQHDVICYSLGFDAPSKTYKALVLFSNLRQRNEDSGELLVLARVFTLGIDSSWRNVNVSIPYESERRHWPPSPLTSPIRIYASISVDNQMFFLISHRRYEIFIKPRLLVFGVQDEKFRLLGPLPEDLTMLVHVFEWNGKLAVISTETETDEEYRDAWILEDHENETWIQRNIEFDSTKFNALNQRLIRDDLLIIEYVENILPLKQITTADQHIYRWGSAMPGLNS